MNILSITQLFFCFLSLTSFSQDNEGIIFSDAKNWEELKLEAKKTNKYIFVDAYTTWCGPCKAMTKDVFTKKEVGTYFNANFINAAIQFDKTKIDNDFVKGWYKDVEQIEKENKIDSYPTYLFFNPEGDLVYKILGASENAKAFISKASNAVIPEKQYYLFRSKYEKGERNVAFIKQLLNSAKDAKDMEFLAKVGNEYLSSQKDIYTKENIEIIKLATANSTDIGFDALRFHPAIIDATLGKGTSYKMVANIISNELVIPYLRNGGSKTELGGGMIKYSGEINNNVDWDELELKLKQKYPELSKKIVLSAKPEYYDWTKDWDKFSQSSIIYLTSYPELLDDELLSYYLWSIVRNSDDKVIIDHTLAWVKKTKTFKEKSNLFILAGYTTLLYKNGDKNESFIAIDEAIKIAKETNKNSYASRLEELKIKMEKGEKTW